MRATRANLRSFDTKIRWTGPPSTMIHPGSFAIYVCSFFLRLVPHCFHDLVGDTGGFAGCSCT